MKLLLTLLTLMIITSCSQQQAMEFEQRLTTSAIIIEEDNRVVSQLGMSSFIKPLTGTQGGVTYQCTSFHISKNIILTAAHCVFKDELMENLIVDGELEVKHVWIAKAFPLKSVTSNDIAILEVENSSSEPSLSNIDIKRVEEDDFDLLVSIAGYSSDKDGALWQDNCVVDIYKENNSVLHSCDTVKGASGAAVMMMDEDSQRISIYGVHVSGHDGILMTNEFVKISPQIYDEIMIIKDRIDDELVFFEQFK